MTEYAWEPLSLEEAGDVFAALGVAWWIAGGEAIDLFVGRKTRAHGDLDIAILRSDVGALTALLAQWDLHIAQVGRLTRWDGSGLEAGAHQFWARRRGADAWAFEVLLEPSEGGDWIYRRDARVQRSIESIGRQSRAGHPYLAPEICLLYKSPPRPEVERNQLDFEVAAPLLDAEAREWLCDALRILDPDHRWIGPLSEPGSLTTR